MAKKNEDLHGNAPDKHKIALLLIDVITDFDFEDGDKLLKNAEPIAEKIAELKKKAQKSGVPVIYVNDNFGKWQSDFTKLLKHCQHKSSKGNMIAKLLVPDENDYFILKPKHSGFYSTTLDLLLAHLESKILVLTGLTTDICVLFTASDSYLRDFDIFVPPDCTAATEHKEHQHALKYIERVLKADTRPSDEIDFDKL